VAMANDPEEEGLWEQHQEEEKALDGAGE